MKPCCALRFALKGFQEGFAVAPEGSRFTCAKCGQNFRKLAWRWEPMTRAEAAQDIIDMQAAEDARQAQHSQ